MLTGSIADSILFITPVILSIWLILIIFFKINLISNTKSRFDKINAIEPINSMFYLCFILITNFIYFFIINYLFFFKN